MVGLLGTDHRRIGGQHEVDPQVGKGTQNQREPRRNLIGDKGCSTSWFANVIA